MSIIINLGIFLNYYFKWYFFEEQNFNKLLLKVKIQSLLLLDQNLYQAYKKLCKSKYHNFLISKKTKSLMVSKIILNYL